MCNNNARLFLKREIFAKVNSKYFYPLHPRDETS